MPIQRVFSAKGFGTVVTGVPRDGTAKIGDVVEILPREIQDACGISRPTSRR
jgi:selenocysteine-specific translation elongation factor